MAVSYKRILVQVPFDDAKKFKEYSSKNNLSFSKTIIFLARKGLEQENILFNLPEIINILNEEQKNTSKTNKKVSKKKVK